MLKFIFLLKGFDFFDITKVYMLILFRKLKSNNLNSYLACLLTKQHLKHFCCQILNCFHYLKQFTSEKANFNIKLTKLAFVVIVRIVTCTVGRCTVFSVSFICRLRVNSIQWIAAIKFTTCRKITCCCRLNCA